MKKISGKILLVMISLLFAGEAASATDGYFLTGYGTIQQGQGGAGVAKPGDSLAGATNPAGLLLVGNRFDIGLTLFRPNRTATISGSGLPASYGLDGTYDGNRVKNFELPELGYSLQYRPNLSLGVAIYGNGGLNTSYTTPIPLFGSTRGGVNIEQVFISPTLAYKAGAHNYFGIAANIAIQLFADEGLQNFESTASSDPTKVSNNGNSYGKGGGVRVGWLGELNKSVSVGATYQSRTWVSKFDRYSGLFAERGGFDVPANFAGGTSVKLGSKATLLFDEERILYGSVKSIANPLASTSQLGTDSGPGFGWHDINVSKVGFDYDVNPSLTLRGGYNHSGVPFDSSQAFFNILAPAVTKDHLHAGATISLNSGKEISFAYIHAFNNTVNGASAIPAAYGGGNVGLSMYQNSFQAAFGWNKNKK